MADFSTEEIDLTRCAIAVFDNPEELAAAIAELDRRGDEYHVLEGEKGQESLQPKQEGVVPMLQRLAAAFGDELRIIDRLDRSLADGDSVVVVKAEDNQAEIVRLLTERGGHFLWQFREWTFNPAGSAEEKDTGRPETGADEDGS
jgi:hypothetical protein